MLTKLCFQIELFGVVFVVGFVFFFFEGGVVGWFFVCLLSYCYRGY